MCAISLKKSVHSVGETKLLQPNRYSMLCIFSTPCSFFYCGVLVKDQKRDHTTTLKPKAQDHPFRKKSQSPCQVHDVGGRDCKTHCHVL
jgi:hypothetical protein